MQVIPPAAAFLLAIVLAPNVIYLFLTWRIFGILESELPDTYSRLGSPRFGVIDLPAFGGFLRFMWTKESRASGSNELRALVWPWRVTFALAIILFAFLVAVVFYSWTRH